MKKLVLAMLMVVMLAVPCMAEIEPEWLFGVEGTYWTGVFTTAVTTDGKLDLAFSGGNMYMCNAPSECQPLTPTSVVTTSYIDIFLLTIFSSKLTEGANSLTINGILFPFLNVGWGAGDYIADSAGGVLYPLSATFMKITDTWTP